MKQRHKVCLRVISWLYLLLAIAASPAFARPLNSFLSTPSADGPVINFTEIDVQLADQDLIPTSGWVRENRNGIKWYSDIRPIAGKAQTLWGRVRFDRRALGNGPIAIYTQDNREQIKVFVNSKEVFRNFAKPDDRVLSWYRPYIIPLSSDALKSGENEIIFRVSSTFSLAVGRIEIGAQPALQKRYAVQNTVRITGPIVANYAMLIMGLAALLMWFVRRVDTELLFFALTAVMWMVRDYHFFAIRLPFDPVIFYGLTVYALYFAAAASSAFCLVFLKIPGREKIIPVMFGFGLFVCILHAAFRVTELVVYIPTFLIAILTSFLGFMDLRRAKTPDHMFLSLVMASLTLSSTHDFGRNEELWHGLGFYLQPYIGFTFMLAFLLSFGRRSLAAITELGHMNQTLETRIAEARDELGASEVRRQALEVDRAIVTERERMMREMHDGIGSNLVTALAIAEKQQQPATTIKTLRRAVADLKITVDSLEPVKGDLVVLIGNLRHRMAQDLKAAGLISKWEVGHCSPLPWIDASNALHVLRIFQEAISNVIAHSGATTLRIGCHEEVRDGVLGVVAFVTDDGRSIDPEAPSHGGKGLSNMRGRAESLHGQFAIAPAEDGGTRMTLWLPYDRPEQRKSSETR